jgi:hypothetical protein
VSRGKNNVRSKTPVSAVIGLLGLIVTISSFEIRAQTEGVRAETETDPIRVVDAPLTGAPPSGPHAVIVEHDQGL